MEGFAPDIGPVVDPEYPNFLSHSSGQELAGVLGAQQMTAALRLQRMNDFEEEITTLESKYHSGNWPKDDYDMMLLERAALYQRSIGVLPFQRARLREKLKALICTGEGTLTSAVQGVRTESATEDEATDYPSGF